MKCKNCGFDENDHEGAKWCPEEDKFGEPDILNWTGSKFEPIEDALNTKGVKE